MGLIKEPLNVDFYFDGKQMTDADQKRVSDFISRQKESKKKNTQIKSPDKKTLTKV